MPLFGSLNSERLMFSLYFHKLRIKETQATPKKKDEALELFLQAINEENCEAIRQYIKNGFNLSIVFDSMTLLQYAIQHKRPLIAKLLIESGVNTADGLISAYDYNMIEIFEILYRKDPTALWITKTKLLHRIIDRNDEKKWVHLLIQLGAKVDEPINGLNAFQQAVEKNYVPLITYTLNYLVEREIADLYNAVLGNDLMRIEALLSSNRMLINTSCLEVPPLFFAIHFNKIEPIKLLVRYGAALNTSYQGESALALIIRIVIFDEALLLHILQHGVLVNEAFGQELLEIALNNHYKTLFFELTQRHLLSEETLRQKAITFLASELCTIAPPTDKLIALFSYAIELNWVALANELTLLPYCDITSHEFEDLLQQATQLARQEIIDLILFKQLQKTTSLSVPFLHQEKALLNGPLNRTLATGLLELIIKIILHDKDNVNLVLHKNYIIATIVQREIPLSPLFFRVNWEHLYLNENDSQAYMRLAPSKKECFYPEKDLFEPLTSAEKQAIHCYTEPHYHDLLNRALYQDVLPSDCNLALLITTLGFIHSGLNKIKPTPANTPLYRGEQNTPHHVLISRKRIAKLTNGGILYTPGIMSSSLQKEMTNNFVLEKYPIRVEFENTQGKNICELSAYQHEEECLIQPGYFCWTQAEEPAANTYEFKATQITPLVEERHLPQGKEMTHYFFLYQRTQNLTPLTASLARSFSHLQNHQHILNLLDPTIFEIIGYLYKHHLSTAFSDKSCLDDWEVSIPFKDTIQRPNHGLRHTLCVAALVPIATRLLNASNARMSLITQVAGLFFVVGRKNECSFHDNPQLFSQFRHDSAKIGYQILTQFQTKLGWTQAEIERCQQLILNYDLPKNDSWFPYQLSLRIAHNADVLRFLPENIEQEIMQAFLPYLSQESIDFVLNYAHCFQEVTGERMMTDPPSDYQSHFYEASTDPHYCLERMLEVAAPFEDYVTELPNRPPSPSP